MSGSDKFDERDCDILHNKNDEGTVNSKKYKYITKGGQGSIYFMFFDECCVALKLVTIEHPVYKKWRELYILERCTKLVKSRVTQNLPILYKHQKCTNNNKDTLMLYSELADGDLLTWLTTEHSVNDWKSMLFQIWHALHVLQTKLKLVHNDLRLPNILFFNSKKPTNFKYTMDNDDYYLEDPKYVFTIWDFGSSELLDYSNKHKDSVKNKLESNNDLHFLHDLYKRLRVLALTTRYTIDEFEDLLSKNKDDQEYIRQTKSENMKKFTKDRFDEKYKISLAYYIMETNRFQELYEKRKNKALPKHNKIYIPPKEVDNLLKTLSDNYNYRYKEAISKYGPTTRKIPGPKRLIDIFLPEYKDAIDYSITFTS